LPALHPWHEAIAQAHNSKRRYTEFASFSPLAGSTCRGLQIREEIYRICQLYTPGVEQLLESRKTENLKSWLHINIHPTSSSQIFRKSYCSSSNVNITVLPKEILICVYFFSAI
jgi:hypothetical protein